MLEIKSLSQFNKLKSTPLLVSTPLQLSQPNANTHQIIDFYADWCAPCKQISPAFERLTKPHESSPLITFAKVNVDKAKDVAQLCGIAAMPTFQYFKLGKKVDEVKGADIQQLTTKIGYYTAAIAKEGVAPATKTKTAESSNSAPAGPGSLRSLIDVDGGKMLNNTIISSVRNIANPPPVGYTAASSTGAQLLMHIPFTQPVTPTHIKIMIAKESASNAPSRIQIGSNVIVHTTTSKEGIVSNDLDMEMKSAENTQSFNIFSDEYVNGTTELKLKASKFTGVKSLTVRVVANMSGEESTISKIGEMDIIGSRV
jgi:thiol-disulfide isomerase/thioredoxin